MAEDLHSIRYVTRLQQMSDRLNHTSLGQGQALKELREVIRETLQRMSD
jgi:hypothetical protein